MLDVKVEQFEGPLELLVRLIENEKLPITEVSLAAVTDQYLAQLSLRSADASLDDLADFLVVAARLLLIKSRKLIPHISVEEESEIQDLERKLKIYQEFAAAAKILEKIYNHHRVLFSRHVRPTNETVRFSPPSRLKQDKLAAAMADIIKRQEPSIPQKKFTLDSRISVQEKIATLKSALLARAMCTFRSIVGEDASRADLIVSFLALLEIVKQQHATVLQSALFDDIHIERFAAAKV